MKQLKLLNQATDKSGKHGKAGGMLQRISIVQPASADIMGGTAQLDSTAVQVKQAAMAEAYRMLRTVCTTFGPL